MIHFQKMKGNSPFSDLVFKTKQKDGDKNKRRNAKQALNQVLDAQCDHRKYNHSKRIHAGIAIKVAGSSARITSKTEV